MTTSLSNRLLLLAADFADFHRVMVSVPRAIAVMSSDTRWHKERRWLEQRLRRSKGRRQCQRAIRELARAGFLRQRRGGLEGYLLTEKGECRVLRLKIAASSLGQKKLPNRQWLMVFFDIPEKLRRQRDSFRRMLQCLSFEQLQLSIWVSRYDVVAAVRRLITQFRLKPYVRVLIVREIPGGPPAS